MKIYNKKIQKSQQHNLISEMSMKKIKNDMLLYLYFGFLIKNDTDSFARVRTHTPTPTPAR